jgi:hypothetical protein
MMVSVAVEERLERMQEERDIRVFYRHLSLQTDMCSSVRFNLASCRTRPNGVERLARRQGYHTETD